MKQARFEEKGGNLKIVQVPIPEPNRGEVRIEVYACGVCHSDVAVRYGAFGNTFPRAPGHEVAGVVDAVGEGVTDFKKGDKVGVGWFGGHCGSCQPCRKNQWVACQNGKVCGISYDGGYAEYLVVPHDAIARMPQELDFASAGPLLCAGITTYNSLRNSGADYGSNCVILGVGGLGHLAVQFANKMGFKVITVSSGKSKEELAKKLGAHVYIDSSEGNVVERIKSLGGADLILATAPSAKSIEEIIPALGVGGRAMIVGVTEGSFKVDGNFLLMNRASITGWASGDSRDSEDTLKFAITTGVETMIEKFPLDKAQEAFDKMLKNEARFRCVLTMK